ncbi:hypothetical protein TcWFU_008967 [Taenia crassiceps]|uniref:Uncharacterized protein n=1 Tax=Taenia crassiceps TaxID=6207 RepID=A0ABR4QF21_9CEST
MISELDQKVLRDLYAWVDSIPLSRPKRNIRQTKQLAVTELEVSAQPGTIEKLLLLLRSKFREHETDIDVNANEFSSNQSPRIVLPSVVTPASNLQRLRRIPSFL